MEKVSKEKKYHISQVLKKCRIENHLSLNDVISYLSNNNIQKIQSSTLYSWENGQSLPNIDTFLNLCKLYHIQDILYTFSYDNAQTEQHLLNSLSYHEQKMILSYRSNPLMHDAIQKLLS